MADLIGIPSAQVTEAIWDDVRPYIVRALDEGDGEYLPGDILKGLIERDMQLWVAKEGQEIVGAGVTEIVRFPRKQVAYARLWAAKDGYTDAWIHTFDTIKAWAKAQGCDCLDVFGRPGWIRALKGWNGKNAILRWKL